METIHVTFDELSEQTASGQSCSEPAPNLLTPGPISSVLVQNSPPATPYVPPTSEDLKKLFDPMFDEYFEPLSEDTTNDSPQLAPLENAPDPHNSGGQSESVSISQEAPSISHSPTTSSPQPSMVQHLQQEIIQLKLIHSLPQMKLRLKTSLLLNIPQIHPPRMKLV